MASAQAIDNCYNCLMATIQAAPVPYRQPYRYASPNIPLSAIRRFARQIAERFRPEKIILFGSYAYGRPHNESDVDLLVIMPAYDVVNQEIRIGLAPALAGMHQKPANRQGPKVPVHAEPVQSTEESSP